MTSSTPNSSLPGPSIVVLAGGIGGARFLVGVREVAQAIGASVTAVVNTGDDTTMHGLRICPDLDSVMYTLAGAADPERGWGRVGETWTVSDELKVYGAEPTWFGLGDRDIATHLVRTQMLEAGYGLSQVTEALTHRWQTGVRLLPMTDQRCETHVIADVPGDEPGTTSRRAIHFQEWWVRHRAGVPTYEFVQIGRDQARPAPGVLEAIAAADVVLVAPSNPVVSIGTILGVPGLADALTRGPAPVVGLSPIVGGAPVRGMADRCLPVIGVDTTAEAVGRHYGARSAGGLLDGWLIDAADTADVPGVEVLAVPLMMTDTEATATMVRSALDLAAQLRRPGPGDG